ncbi:hypothetical protein MRX96_024437 [Rhipicephalus microplus]
MASKWSDQNFLVTLSEATSLSKAHDTNVHKISTHALNMSTFHAEAAVYFPTGGLTRSHCQAGQASKLQNSKSMRLSTLSCVLLSSAAAYHSSPSSATIHANSQPSLVQ